MQTETLVGLISGLGGAVIGAGGALLGGLQQQRHQARTTREQKIEDLGRAAGDKVLTELYALRRHLMECGQGDIPEEHQPWDKIARNQMDTAELALGLMPGAGDVRTRVKEALDLAESGVIYALRADLHVNTQLMHLFGGCSEAIEVVSAYMRGDPIPAPSRWVERRRREEQRGQGRSWQALRRDAQSPSPDPS
ncbi:hypothetical protein ACH5A3_02910 [Streptomyces echinatus]|uniref:hypothetical protein n=1 Tax=Streptomyces echinatus TaxID=67293 RepID=UPI0037B4B84F